MEKNEWDLEFQIKNKSFWLYYVPTDKVIDIDREVSCCTVEEVGLDKLKDLWEKYGDDVEITMKKISMLPSDSTIYVTEY